MLAFFFWKLPMTDYLKVNLANWNDRAAIHVKDEAGGYRVKEFLNGADNLHGIEDREIGDVRGNASPICNVTSASTRFASRGAARPAWGSTSRPSPSPPPATCKSRRDLMQPSLKAMSMTPAN